MDYHDFLDLKKLTFIISSCHIKFSLSSGKNSVPAFWVLELETILDKSTVVAKLYIADAAVITSWDSFPLIPPSKVE